MKKPLLIICIVCGLLAVFFQYHQRHLLWLFKPLPMILMTTWLYLRGIPSTYRTLIMVGFVFSLIGDVFLIIPETYFLHGLCSFFVAHLLYIAAFYKSSKGFDRRSLAALSFGFVVFFAVQSGIPNDLRIPVIAYTLAISTMLCMALNFWITQKTPRAKMALIGASLFVISDSLIAINKFSYPFFLARFIILLAYFIAQGFIAYSVERTPTKVEG